MPEVLSAPLVVEFPFTRSLGPVQSAFLTGLRERTLLGVRASDGRILMPPVEYDPVTAEELRDLVEVAGTGTVTTWAWNPHPRPGQPLTAPFAWVLVRLDGADTALLHALDARGPEEVSSGTRVRVRWAAERRGAITDIVCFERLDEGGRPDGHADSQGKKSRQSDNRPERPRATTPHTGRFDGDPVTGIVTAARLDYTYTSGRAQSRFLTALTGRRIIGERCPDCRKTYVPPRGACPTCGVATDEQVEVGPRGTVTTYCVVNVKARNLDIEVPYVYAHIALDGADLGLHARIGGIPYDQVRMGLRVEAVWVDDDRLAPTLASVDHFRPTGEPDADYDTYKELL
ncbi:Zn-ribbon domain-containing OB-fold protein [Wenjunlia tyrosinilytica]|uniref:DNA-binding protein n=1 Tax=Wenjunlia tyrosinilytica TaxID=1544741 RepID=A0A917ZYA3_9ACTN|nr:OB-fold nucleic acid binding domain-containing protein [Wenjunlia tyrosinilytica]GGO97007.1 DNA-binding protein [Wenjunlia tyrosinilytica]